MEVKIKKLHENAVIPTYAKNGDAGMDLTATSKSYDDHGNVVYGTGLAFEIPEGYVGLLFPRSSNTKKDLILGNSVGVLDSGYRGEVAFKFKPLARIEECTDDSIHINDWYDDKEHYEIGERIGQIIILPYPKIEFFEVDELEDSERGDGGFGSSGA
jgi:dUTP pyrophosphatase